MHVVESRPPPASMPPPDHTPISSKFMDEKELCVYLAISSVTATKWRAKAEGPPYIKVGRLVRYRRTDVEAWLASRTIDDRPRDDRAYEITRVALAASVACARS